MAAIHIKYRQVSVKGPGWSPMQKVYFKEAFVSSQSNHGRHFGVVDSATTSCCLVSSIGIL